MAVANTIGTFSQKRGLIQYQLIFTHKPVYYFPCKKPVIVTCKGIAAKVCSCLNILRLGIVRDLKNSPVQSFIFNRLVDGVIVNVEPIKKQLLDSGFKKPEKIRIIYNGLNKQEIAELAGRQTVNLPFDFTVSAMEELSPRKGFDMLIRGFALFLEISGAKNTGLVIIGEGASKEALQKLAHSLKIDNKVIFTGFLENPFPYLVNSRIFAMASINEGISNALLEAIYLNNAPIITRAGGATEVITDGENGFLVPYGDEEQLTLTMKKLFTDRSLTKNIALKARQKVIEQFSIEHMNKKIENFCKEMILKKQQLKQ